MPNKPAHRQTAKLGSPIITTIITITITDGGVATTTTIITTTTTIITTTRDRIRRAVLAGCGQPSRGRISLSLLRPRLGRAQ